MNGLREAVPSRATHNVSCTFPAYTIKINESYWWDVTIERTNPRVNVEFLSVGMRYLAQ